MKRRDFLKASAVIGAATFLGNPRRTQAFAQDSLATGKPDSGKSPDTVPKNAAPTNLPYDGLFPQHEPYGKGVGVMPGRVVWAYDPETVHWTGDGWWWSPENFDEDAIQSMINKGIASLANKKDAATGWKALFEAHNKLRQQTGGYQPGQKIAIKVNINGSGVFGDDDSGETNMDYTNPVVLKCLLQSLVSDANVAPEDITVYDISRLFPRYMVELCTEDDLAGIRFVGRDTVEADTSAPIVWSQSFEGAQNYLPTCVTEADYLINLASLKGHSYGITLSAKNHFGSFWNGNTLRPPEGARLHGFVSGAKLGSYTPLVDLLATEHLGGKTMLYLLDGLICAPSEGADITFENSQWQQDPFNNGFTASLIFSQDALAIDSVGADLLMNEPAVTERNGALRGNTGVESYLHEAALGETNEAPSGTNYAIEGHVLTNLGVHEHWNNSVDKLYSRNLGKDEGIELVRIEV